MIRITLIVFCLLAALTESGRSQTKVVRVKDLHLKNTYEQISVLTSNPNIKEGPYKRVINGKLSVEGSYQDNNRFGIWRMYNHKNKIELEIDYNSGQLKYLSKDSISKMEQYIESEIKPKDRRPLVLTSSSNLKDAYLIQDLVYPPYAVKNGISGKVIIEVIVDSIGLVTSYSIGVSINKVLDEEALRVIKMVPLEFLPEYQNGIAVNSVYKVTVIFSITDQYI